VWVVSDPELVQGRYEGDHAGKYEISQLLFIRPDLVRMEYISEVTGGPLAIGADAADASREFGEAIMNACLKQVCQEASEMKVRLAEREGATDKVSYAVMEEIWSALWDERDRWRTAVPAPGQGVVSEQSQWKQGEYDWRRG
jgi:creatinine amidohydrolase